MAATTAWIKKTYHTKGLDPLGAQAPAINIYGQLLPGITNVTDRARYYSFYPWMVWAYDQLPGEKTQTDFVEWVRRADCLFTMIGIRHRYTSGGEDLSRHEQGLVGSQTLHQVVANLGPSDTLRLSDYTVLEDGNPLRYFKNRLGGLKQYYIGTFDGLGLMTSRGAGVAYTEEGGKPLAEAMDSSVNRKLFTEAVRGNEITAAHLDALTSFCPCQLPSSPAEHAALVNLFFERGPSPTEEGLQRRHTLALMLDLVRTMALDGDGNGPRFDQAAYRGCVYAGALPGGKAWELPSKLEATRMQWRAYQRHELLSVAVQCLFWVALDSLYTERPELASTEDFTRWFEGQPWVVAAANELGGGDWATAAKRTRDNLPALSDWLDEEHEITLARKALEACSAREKREVRGELLQVAGKLLLTLAARDDGASPAYDPLTFPADYFTLYPINLESLRRLSKDHWPTLSLPQWLAWVAGHWGIEAHLRVALRKLRYQTKDTFHVLPTDQGFTVAAMPEPTYTSPRFFQAVQILEDLGAIDRRAGAGAVTLNPLGEELWRGAHG
ncbi:MAG: hypothetical protein P1P84_05640 [Deferrisomatales bacterium]|nr:hypothetical protein [Deferrisomatales bacterium]